MIASIGAYVPIAARAVWSEDEHTSQLPRITLHTALSKSLAQRSQGGERQPRGEDLDTAPPKSGRTIGAELRIDQDGAVEPLVLAERCREVRGAVPDDDELGPSGVDVIQSVAQLRDLLTAEQSAEVSDEGEHDRAVRPERAQPHRSPLPVVELEVGEPRRNPHG